MNTFYSLLVAYGKPQVPLMEIWPDFLPELSERVLKARARHQQLPFPVLPGKTQKSVYLVDLRDASRRTNARNRRIQPRTMHGSRGVRWCVKSQKWVAYIKIDGAQKHIGQFSDKLDAETARWKAEREHGFHDDRLRQPA